MLRGSTGHAKQAFGFRLVGVFRFPLQETTRVTLRVLIRFPWKGLGFRSFGLYLDPKTNRLKGSTL